MKIAILPFALICGIFLSVPAVSVAQSTAKLFTVNDIGDTNDSEPGDRICADANGRCTLRAAVQEANTNATDRDVVIFAIPLPAVINLTNGPLTITAPNMAIVGPGARRLTVQRSPEQTASSRIFSVPNSGSNAVIRAMTIRNGLAGQLLPGGAAWIGAGASLSFYDAAITSNSAGTGGGIANDGTLLLMRVLVAGNNAGFQGGGVHATAGSSTRIVNSTITDNQAPTGGGIWNAGSMLLVNDTVSHNGATSNASSAFNNSGASFYVLNSIVGSDNASTAVSLSGSFTSLGNNIITDARTSTGFTNGSNNDQVSDNNKINPLLGPLLNNGGQTDTRALQSNSPAVNAANNCVREGNCSLPFGSPLLVRWDQRLPYFRFGFAPVDIGAFEFGANPVGGVGTFSGSFQAINGLYLGSIVILTDTETNEKQYAVVNQFNRHRFQTYRPGVVYVQETISKRQFFSSVWIMPLFD